jgi:Ca2+:H+ antiporter
MVTERWLNLLLLLAPVSIGLDWWYGASIWVFVAAAAALIPAAGLIGTATEHLARRAGPTLGGFLNATFGNAAELIIAIAALAAHRPEVVKASITGSIIGNLLLVFGLSCFAGGLRHGKQRFNRMAAALAHQVRTPLASAILYLSNVRLGRGDEALRQKCTEQALSRLQHLEGLVADMLLFARGGAFEATELSIADLLSEVVRDSNEHDNDANTFTVEIIDATGAARTHGNRDALASALRNLVDNADRPAAAADRC